MRKRKVRNVLMSALLTLCMVLTLAPGIPMKVQAAGISLTISPATLDFGSMTAGEGRPSFQGFTVTANGGDCTNVQAVIRDGDRDKFEIYGSDVAESLTSGSYTKFFFYPKDGLAAGTYSATVAIKADQTEAVTGTLTFTVLAASGGEPGNNTDNSSNNQNNGGTPYENPLRWYYPKDQPHALCVITQQGALCTAAFKSVMPAQMKEAFSFDLLLNGKMDYDAKHQTLTIYYPDGYKMKGRTFAMIGVDKTGKAVYFKDQDNNDGAITIDVEGFEGYAFDLIYQDQ